MSIDAQNLFRDAIHNEIERLSAEEKESLNHHISERERMAQEHLKERQREHDEKYTDEENENTETALEDHPDIENLSAEDEPEELPAQPQKISELKKLFHKIAALTHPDKSAAKGLAPEEAKRLEGLFKHAKSAYESENWYILYSLATQLGIEVKSITEQHLDWVEDDIKATLSKIAHIGNLVAWGWYVGSKEAKEHAIRAYFFQM